MALLFWILLSERRIQTEETDILSMLLRNRCSSLQLTQSGTCFLLQRLRVGACSRVPKCRASLSSRTGSCLIESSAELDLLIDHAACFFRDMLQTCLLPPKACKQNYLESYLPLWEVNISSQTWCKHGLYISWTILQTHIQAYRFHKFPYRCQGS